MMRTCTLFLLVSWLVAVEPPSPRPPAPPVPVFAPQPPLADAAAQLDPQEALLKALRERLAGHDRRIAELLQHIDGRSVAQPTGVDVGDAADERDAALARAAAAAQNFVARRRANGNVPTATSSRSDGSDTLRALNRLAVADCYRRLVLQGGGESELAAGAAALAEIDAVLLSDAEMPTLFYLRTWFLAETARSRDDAAVADQAREAARTLLRDFPHSALARTAQELVRDLPGTVK